MGELLHMRKAVEYSATHAYVDLDGQTDRQTDTHVPHTVLMICRITCIMYITVLIGPSIGSLHAKIQTAEGNNNSSE